MAIFKEDFIKEDPWRVFRIMSEFVDGFEMMTSVDNGISIFGSAQATISDRYYRLARKTAYMLAKKGFSIITGAGPGIMEAANKGAKEAGGESIGLNILIPQRQRPNKYLTKMMEFKYFFCRKVMFAKYSHAFIVFPGGFGTLDEFFEAITLIQTHRIEPFPVILVGRPYWKGLLDWISTTLVRNKAISKRDIKIFNVVDTPEEILKILSGPADTRKSRT